MTGHLLSKSLEEAPVVNFNGYQYFVHPLTDGIPAIEPALLDEIVDDFCKIADFSKVQRIVTVEAMGIPVATALSLHTDIPVSVIRKRKYGLPGEVEIGQNTGYSKGSIFVNGLSAGAKVIFVDDVISTGGTLAPLLRAFKDMRVEVRDILVVVEKGDGRARIEKEFGLRVKTLARIAVVDGRVRLEHP